MLLNPVRIFPVATVIGAHRGLHIGNPPGFRAEDPQEGGRIHCTRPHFRAARLEDGATDFGPILLGFRVGGVRVFDF